jgi:hypothetical protein
MGLIDCPEMPVTNCQSVLHNMPEVWGTVPAVKPTVPS